MTTPRIGIIGAGNMGGALFNELSKRDVNVRVYSRHFAASRALAQRHASPSLTELLAWADCLIIAVKPQSFKGLAVELRGRAAKKLIISIMAGITLKRVAELTGAKKVVRAMPNLPCRVGAGVTGWMASRAVSAVEKVLVKKIFSALGMEITLKSEPLINKLSTVSGSGPAYFFYLTEILETKLRAFGFAPAVARQIAATTFQGAAKLLATDNKSAKEWRAAVSSKKGITLAAIKELQRQKLPQIFAGAIKKALKRTDEISKSL